ncbi:MAG TPA: hypothetical protein VFN09_08495 [Rhodanobacteraceae bacterium]|nr:hypothetical protein [Rhodanobacteraceae bacterium]
MEPLDWIVAMAPLTAAALLITAWQAWLGYRLRRDLRRLTAALRARQDAQLQEHQDALRARWRL